MKLKCCRFNSHDSWLLLGSCVAFSLPAKAQTPVEAQPVPTEEKKIPAPNVKSKTPMMDILVLELLKGEPINDYQAKEVVDDELGKIWYNKDPYPVDPTDSKEVKAAKYHAWVYLAALKASFLYPDRHDGWPVGYGKLHEEGFPRLMLTQLKAMAAAPLNKVNRTIVNYAIIVPAWIANDPEALAMSDRERQADWAGDSRIAKDAAVLKQWAQQRFPRK